MATFIFFFKAKLWNKLSTFISLNLSSHSLFKSISVRFQIQISTSILIKLSFILLYSAVALDSDLFLKCFLHLAFRTHIHGFPPNSSPATPQSPLLLPPPHPVP